MTKGSRRFLTTATALIALAGCSTTTDVAASVVPLSDVAASASGRVSSPVVETTKQARAARVISRSAARAVGTVEFDVAGPSVAERPAVRVDPPDAEREQADGAETVVIEQVWLDLAECESNQRWSYNGSSGYDGGLQFSPSTWRAVDGTDFAEFAWQATPFEQVTVAERLLEVQGWGAWPSCSRKLGLR